MATNTRQWDLRKASGKNGLCPDCGYVRWDCRCLAEALKRIAELEAELAEERDANNGWREEVRNLTSGLAECQMDREAALNAAGMEQYRAEKAEAELAAAKEETNTFAETASREERLRRKAEAELAEYRSAEHIYGKHFAECAEKAEAELDKTRAELGHQWGLAKAAEAEVEWWHARDPEGWAFYKRVNPSGDTLGGGGRESGSVNATAPTGNTDRGKPSFVPAAANPAARSDEPLPRRGSRKERDDG